MGAPDWTAVAAIGGPITAVVAVYLAYRLQVKTIRKDRLHEAAADLLGFLDRAVFTIESLVLLTTVLAPAKKASAPMPDALVRQLNKSSRDARVQIGLELGDWPGRGVAGQLTAPLDAVAYAEDTMALAGRVLYGLSADLWRSSGSLELLGLSKDLVSKVRAVAKKLEPSLASLERAQDLVAFRTETEAIRTGVVTSCQLQGSA